MIEPIIMINSRWNLIENSFLVPVGLIAGVSALLQ